MYKRIQTRSGVAVIMWKSRLKCGLLCKNKIVTIFLLLFLIPQNGTYLTNMLYLHTIQALRIIELAAYDSGKMSV